MKRKQESSKNSNHEESGRESNGRFKKGHHWRKHKPFWEKDFLENEYTTKKKSAAEIAQDFGVTENAILFWIKKLGIKTRSISEVRKNKKWGLSGKQNGMYGRCGCENPRWIDGSSPLRQTMYARSFWKELAKAVYEKDNYKCVRCGCPHSGKNKLHAHHVKPWAGNPDARFELENIITLCKECHNWVHSKGNTDHEFLSL